MCVVCVGEKNLDDVVMEEFVDPGGEDVNYYNGFNIPGWKNEQECSGRVLVGARGQSRQIYGDL